MLDHVFAPRKPGPPDLPAHARSQDLLRPPPADAERFFQDRPVHPRIRQRAQPLRDFFQVPAPQWLIRHETPFDRRTVYVTRLCACAQYGSENRLR
jgi:hypothetical protein